MQQQAYIPQRLPDSMSPPEIGAHMAKLRQQFNLTQQEVSARLHIRPRYVSAIEEGKFELLPGKVYARGYVHTYAEFLGLDPEHVVAQCFTGENAAAVAVPVTPLPRSAPRHHPARASTPWRSYAILGVAGLVLLLVVTQLTGRNDDAAQQEQAVAPVPEAMLQSVRNLFMPTPTNYDCLTRNATLECFYADTTTRALMTLDTDMPLHFTGDLDLSTMILLPPAAPDAAAEEGEKPAEGTSKVDEKSNEKSAEE